MSLIVSPNTAPRTLAAGHLTAAPHSASSLRWMWAAMALLALCVVALAAALWTQTHQTASTDAQAALASAAPRTPDAEIIDENSTPALAGKVQVAPKNVAITNVPAASAYPAPAQASRSEPPLYASTRAPVACATCGRVESVQAVQQAAPATGVGAVAGGVLGAVVGNQVGKGSGRAAATVLGAVGGGYVGHKVEERTRTQTVYQVAVRMEDGSVRRFTRAQPPAVGTPVVLQGKGFRVDDGATRAAEPYPRAQPGAVRVADTY